MVFKNFIKTFIEYKFVNKILLKKLQKQIRMKKLSYGLLLRTLWTLIHNYQVSGFYWTLSLVSMLLTQKKYKIWSLFSKEKLTAGKIYWSILRERITTEWVWYMSENESSYMWYAVTCKRSNLFCHSLYSLVYGTPRRYKLVYYKEDFVNIEFCSNIDCELQE